MAIKFSLNRHFRGSPSRTNFRSTAATGGWRGRAHHHNDQQEQHMKRLHAVAFAAVALAGISQAQAQAKFDCSGEIRTIYDRMNQISKEASGDKLAEAMRRAVRAYDACQSGDSLPLKGVFDQIEADLKKK
jgi:hypothetical protein